MKYLFIILAITFTGSVAADDADTLIREEVRDAEARQQVELDDRVRDLERQQQASKAIAEKQQQLIDALQAQIRALQERNSDRSDRKE